MGKVCHQLQNLFPFGICHVAGCAIGSLVGICNVPLFIMSSVLVPFHPVKQDCEVKQHSGSQDEGIQTVWKTDQDLQAVPYGRGGQ